MNPIRFGAACFTIEQSDLKGLEDVNSKAYSVAGKNFND